jgi:hypothetical protein
MTVCGTNSYMSSAPYLLLPQCQAGWSWQLQARKCECCAAQRRSGCLAVCWLGCCGPKTRCALGLWTVGGEAQQQQQQQQRRQCGGSLPTWHVSATSEQLEHSTAAGSWPYTTAAASSTHQTQYLHKHSSPACCTLLTSSLFNNRRRSASNRDASAVELERLM